MQSSGHAEGGNVMQASETNVAHLHTGGTRRGGQARGVGQGQAGGVGVGQAVGASEREWETK